jgi:hypothetical protein
LAYYLEPGRHEGGIRLDSVEVGTRLKVTISYSTNYKFILPVLDILINLFGDFPEMRGKIMRMLQGIKKEYGFKVSLNSPESIIYQLFAGTDANSAYNLSELIQLWNNDVASTNAGAGEDALAAKPESEFEDTTGWDTILIEMWNKGYSRDEIAKRATVTMERVTNRVTELMNKFGKEKVPYDKERKKFAKIVIWRDTA